jgi:hypothetical protein
MKTSLGSVSLAAVFVLTLPCGVARGDAKVSGTVQWKDRRGNEKPQDKVHVQAFRTDNTTIGDYTTTRPDGTYNLPIPGGGFFYLLFWDDSHMPTTTDPLSVASDGSLPDQNVTVLDPGSCVKTQGLDAYNAQLDGLLKKLPKTHPAVKRIRQLRRNPPG